MGSTAKISSRTRSRTKSEATVQPFLQDARNLDLVGLILQQLLDSTEGHRFASVEVVRERTDGAGVVIKYKAHEAGGIFKGIQYDYYMCTHAVVQALSLVCRLWDEVRARLYNTRPTLPLAPFHCTGCRHPSDPQPTPRLDRGRVGARRSQGDPTASGPAHAQVQGAHGRHDTMFRHLSSESRGQVRGRHP